MRREFECVGGPHCGKRLFAPELGEPVSIRVPADPRMPLGTLRLMVGVETPANYRTGVYQVMLAPDGDFIYRWQGDD